jgi:pectate lyase
VTPLSSSTIRVGLALGAALLGVGCGDARLYPIQKTPPDITECPTNLVGFAALGTPTMGGAHAAPISVSTEAELHAAAQLAGPAVIHVNGTITLVDQVDVTSEKTILGVGADAGLTGAGLDLTDVHDVIVRNLSISKVVGADAIALTRSSNIWIDHCDLSSDRLHDDNVDFYDGLIDITHASDFVTVSWTRFHDHVKTTLVGHSADNVDEDDMHLTVTYHHNLFSNTVNGIRTRFGKIHVFNNHFLGVREYAVVSQMNADVLIERNVFENVATTDPYRTITTVYLDDVAGKARNLGNDFRSSGPTNITADSLWTPQYSWEADSAGSVRALVGACAGVGILDVSQLE